MKVFTYTILDIVWQKCQFRFDYWPQYSQNICLVNTVYNYF